MADNFCIGGLRNCSFKLILALARRQLRSTPIQYLIAKNETFWMNSMPSPLQNLSRTTTVATDKIRGHASVAWTWNRCGCSERGSRTVPSWNTSVIIANSLRRLDQMYDSLAAQARSGSYWLNTSYLAVELLA